MIVVGLMDRGYLGRQTQAKSITDVLRNTATPYQGFNWAMRQPHAFLQKPPGALGPKKRGWSAISVRYLVPKGLLATLLPSP